MKITEDIVKALHACIADGYDSVADFANRVNVSANTISKYMRRETEVMQKDTWVKLQPLLTAYLPKDGDKVKYEIEMTADQKILLDAFDSLPPDVQSQKLMEIIQLAKKHLAAIEAAKNAADGSFDAGF